MDNENLEKLKDGINSLINSISADLRQENLTLKKKIAVLEKENQRLSEIVYSKNDNRKNFLEYLKNGKLL